jgi:ATP phosphoribosyltransferase regulatory subunit
MQPMAGFDLRVLRKALAEHFEAAGYQPCEPPILQPASIFFDSGEDMRSRLYLTSDLSGAEYCLRPEYTIPVCRFYLDQATAGSPAAYCYCGPVFRFRPDGASEFIQAGLENFGRRDREAADAEILGRALGAAHAVGQTELTVRLGDAGLFSSLLDALALSPQWRRRIAHGHAHEKPLDRVLALDNGKSLDHDGVLAALAGTDKHSARALVEDLLSIAGISTVGGRSVGEIAERFLEQAALKSNDGFPAEKRAILESFLAIEGDPDDALAKLAELAKAAKLDLAQALDRFDARLGFMAAHGLDVKSFQFAARFARNLDYYTGFVFEAHEKARPDEKPLVAGGRYDGLLKSLGASDDIPAVGAALWVDRLRREPSERAQ